MLLEVEDMHVYYGKSHILKGVSLQVGAGEVVALLGRNGAGKTTTLRGIVGHAGLRRGTIRWQGGAIEQLPPYRRSRRGLGYVPQDKLLFAAMTVEENLKAAARGQRAPHEWDRVYALFPDLRDRRRQKAGTMSGGEQQMLTIARALLTRPRLLLLDEPSTGLMPIMIARVAEVIRKLHAEGISVLIVEEQVPLALQLSSRLYILDVGQVVFSGETRTVDPQSLIQQYMGVACAAP
jgi:branched-chain amino acid transport system ATP-binding protein